MPRFLTSPIGGYGTWVAAGADTPDPPPIRLQGERPILTLPSRSPVEIGSLPRGELTRFVLDDEPVDLWTSALEEVTTAGRRVSFTVLLPEEERPGGRRLLRLRFDLDGARLEERHSALVPRESSLRSVESLQHDGRRGLRLAVYAASFLYLQLTAETLTVTPSWLDARRPPHVKVMWDYTAFGIWDEGPGTGPFDADDLDLPTHLRRRIQAWCDRCEDGDEDPVEQDAIAAELRRAWPHSVVRVHR